MSVNPNQWPSARPPARVELAIGELELVGFPVAHRHAIAGAVERSLTELVATRGWPSPAAAQAGDAPASAGRPTRATAAVTLDAQAAPERVGRAIAEAIFHAAGAAAATRPES